MMTRKADLDMEAEFQVLAHDVAADLVLLEREELQRIVDRTREDLDRFVRSLVEWVG